jgi:hypothetical protein
MLDVVSFAALPKAAAWEHRGARTGFEVAYFGQADGTRTIEGWTTAVEDGRPWVVGYDLHLDASWRTVRATLRGRLVSGEGSTVLESEGEGSWLVDGQAAPHLDGCLDVDLESSALTNTFPVHRLRLAVGEGAPAPAAYVHADLSVDRLEQEYVRAADEGAHQRYLYAAPAFSFTCPLLYDESGLLLDYPGIATRTT